MANAITTSEAHAQLLSAVEHMRTQEDWQHFLALQASQRQYSTRNLLLAWQQGEMRGLDISDIRGYRAWQAVDRQVRKGEGGLRILAPITRKADTPDASTAAEKKDTTIVGFRTVSVFDISQTDGAALPSDAIIVVEGDAPVEVRRGIERLIQDQGFAIHFESEHSSWNGLTNWSTRTVTIKDYLPPAHQVKTLVHELAHIRLGHERASQQRAVAEVEAESVAFMVCSTHGIKTDEYSFQYVGSWASADPHLVIATAATTKSCAEAIITDLQPVLGHASQSAVGVLL